MWTFGSYALATLACLALVTDAARIRDVRQLLSTPCEKGSFLKDFDQTCMVCDENCAEECVDKDGCGSCAKGFFTSRVDNHWPFTCKVCDIENCDKCRDGIYDAWVPQCMECAEGFVQGHNRETCVPDGNVAGVEIVKEIFEEESPVDTGAVGGVTVETEKGSVGGEEVTSSTPSEETITCPEGQFVKTKENMCMDCDANCVEGGCVDGIGCSGCKPGFYRSAVDPFWPFECKECTIENCETCEDGVFDAWPQFCTKCADGYQLTDRTACVAISTPVPEPVQEPIVPEPIVEEPVVEEPVVEEPVVEEPVVEEPVVEEPVVEEPVVEEPVVEEPVAEEPIVASVEVPEAAVEIAGDFEDEVVGTPVEEPVTCPDGQFVKTKENMCMDCDANCADGGCIDGIGCSGCKPGYFRSAEDPFWPFECKKCTIENCEACEDGVFNDWPMFCAKCSDGYELVDRRECVLTQTPAVAGVTVESDDGDAPAVGGVSVEIDGLGDAPKNEDVEGDEPEVVEVQGDDNDSTDASVEVEGSTEASPGVGGHSETTAEEAPEGCPEGYFKKTYDQTCMKCDENCVEGGCVDGIGCTACKPESNTYRTRPDAFWPFTCKSCPIENCGKCLDGVFDAQPVRCEACVNGLDRYNGGTECV